MLVSRWWVWVVGVMVLGLAVGQGLAREEALPRYRLEVGQELVFRQTSESSYRYSDKSYVSVTTTDWKVWVVRANKDGSWRLILRSSATSSQTVDGKKQPDRGQASHALAYCDLFPDGRVVGNDSLGYRMDPTELFPRLPADAAALKKGWEDRDEKLDSLRRYRVASDAKAESGEWAFGLVRESPLDRIYLLDSRSTCFFDREKHLPSRVESSGKQGYGVERTNAGTVKRTSIKKVESGWLESFIKEAERFFAAGNNSHRLMEQAEKDADNCKALAEKAESVLKDARAKVTLPILCEQLDEQIKQHARQAKWAVEDAERRKQVVGKPSPNWKLKDLDGKEHSLEDYRGKVIVVDFWYRGCSWCIRSMPQLNALVEDFKDQPVVLLGMNIDRKEEDARFVVDAMKLKYTTLKADGVNKEYKVQGYPTLLIIDQTGKVAEFHVGYSPTLRKDLTASIRRLIDKK